MRSIRNIFTHAGSASDGYLVERTSSAGFGIDSVQRVLSRHVYVLAILTIIGFAVYFRGLAGPFMGDDNLQIVNNPVVHSLANIPLFFKGSTFYNGQGISPLSGVYYRPLMLVAFSAVYSLFSNQSLPYHVLQLIICILASFILFLVFRYSFKPLLAFVLAAIFLIHPANSQVVLAIPSLQDALFFFFGILALWIALRFSSDPSLVAVGLCILLSLFSKETGILFASIALAYFVAFNRSRLFKFACVLVPTLALYLVLKNNAVPLFGNPQLAPIDNLAMAGRLMTMPSIILFYLIKLVFPLNLASGYYWTYSKFSVDHVIWPLLVDLAAIGVVIVLGYFVRKRGSWAQFLTFMFFALWALLGILTTLQIVPLDLTASETWLYFSMAGFLGMVGTVITSAHLHYSKRVGISILAMITVLLCVYGVRTAMRAGAWDSEYRLASQDIITSPDDYVAYDDLAAAEINRGNLGLAAKYANHSVAIFPTLGNYTNLGNILADHRQYAVAVRTFDKALSYGGNSLTYDNLAAMTLFTGNYGSNREDLQTWISLNSGDGSLWMYLALLDEQHDNFVEAKADIAQAQQLGATQPVIYNGIMSNKPFTVHLANSLINMP